MSHTARLTVTCPDAFGIVAAVASFLTQLNCNITHADQHSSDPTGGTFFLRIQFETELAPELLRTAFHEVARRFDMSWRMSFGERQRMAILVSKYDHCMLDLLWRQRSGELEADIPLVMSNHTELEGDVAFFNLPFAHLPVTKDTKQAQEEQVHELLLEHRVDFIVLARYMQILSPWIVSRWRHKIINIHHSFLPAFIGAKPYHSALERGVKLIGATAHYVTDDLDEGPIIEQDIVRVSHKDSIGDLVRMGRDIERQVLSKAVKWHLEERIVVYGNKTVVF